MNFDEARPEYYEGLKIFQRHTDQQDQLKKLVGLFWHHFKTELSTPPTNKSGDHKLGSLKDLTNTSLTWRDIGSGDGSFTQKVLDTLKETGICAPLYEGIEPDEHFISISQECLAAYPSVSITKGSGFDGKLHERGQNDIISGFNALYFAQDIISLKEDLNKALKITGLGLFIQNTFFTTKAGEAFLGEDYKAYTAAIPTEVFFPSIPERGFDLISNKANVQTINADAELTEKEKANTVLIKQIIDSMGGISTETDAGQKVAQNYRTRILGDEYGGKGRYVSDNLLLVYPHPEAPVDLKNIVKTAMKGVREDISFPSFPPNKNGVNTHRTHHRL